MDIFFIIIYNQYIKGDDMDINELKRELLKYKEHVSDLWRSL